MAAGHGNSTLEELEEFVKYKVETEKLTHEQPKHELQEAFPEKKGFSVSSIQKFCAQKKIKRTTDIDDQHLDEAVSQAVSQVNNCGQICEKGPFQLQAFRDP